MIWVGLLMAAIALTVQALAIGQGLHWQTIVFNVLCLSQMGHVWAIRTERSVFHTNLLSNPALLGAVALTFGLQAMVTFIPVFQEIFHTQALTMEEFLVVTAISSVVFIGVEVEKLFSKRH